jgi:hypothetical protein
MIFENWYYPDLEEMMAQPGVSLWEHPSFAVSINTQRLSRQVDGRIESR